MELQGDSRDLPFLTPLPNTTLDVHMAAVSDSPTAIHMRNASPLEHNWSWSPPLAHAVHVIHEYQQSNNSHTEPLRAIHERVEAGAEILPTLPEETPRPPGDMSAREERPETPCKASQNALPERGAAMLTHMGFEELEKGEVAIM